MKIKLNTNLVVNIVVIGFILLMVATFLAMFFFTGSGKIVLRSARPHKNSTDTYTWENKLKPIDAEISDSLSYRQYIKLRDSIKNTRLLINGEFPVGGGFIISNVLAASEGINPDSTDLKSFFHTFSHSHDEKHIIYYIKLLGWKINDSKLGAFGPDSVQHYVVNKQSYIRKEVEFITKKNGLTNHATKVVDIRVKFRYDHNDQCLMIPVRKSTKNTISILLAVIGITSALYLYYLIADFLKFIIDLSKGLSFTDKNVKRLRLIALSLLIYPIAVFLLNFLIKLIFYNYFTADVVMNNEVWSNSWKIMAVGIIFLLLWKSFRQGKLLKEEQDLTV
jgi:hypothetical protein